MTLTIPGNLADAAERRGPGEFSDWVARIPEIIGDLSERWSLRLGEPYQPGGRCSWVAPARSVAGEDLVLKVSWHHFEAAHEAAGLMAWDGRGAVRLHAADVYEETSALLLERCAPGIPLRASMPEPAQDVVITGLLRRLWICPAGPERFRPLQVMCDKWAADFEAGGARYSIDHGLARDGIALLRSLPATAGRSVLLCTDLHGENVLAARREAWLAIDPKPYLGDPAYDLLQHMLNCPGRLAADPAGLARRMADLAGLGADRVIMWLFARCVRESAVEPWLADVARHLARPGLRGRAASW